MEIGQEVTGEVKNINPRGFLFLSVDNSEDDNGEKRDLFVHARDIEGENFSEIILGTKMVCIVQKDNLKPEDRVKGTDCKILK